MNKNQPDNYDCNNDNNNNNYNSNNNAQNKGDNNGNKTFSIWRNVNRYYINVSSHSTLFKKIKNPYFAMVNILQLKSSPFKTIIFIVN